MTRLERALADLLGGHESGWLLYFSGLSQLELAAANSRARGVLPFRNHPDGELHRLYCDLDGATRTIRTAVELEKVLSRDDDLGDRRADLALDLLGRARELADRRLHDRDYAYELDRELANFRGGR